MEARSHGLCEQIHFEFPWKGIPNSICLLCLWSFAKARLSLCRDAAQITGSLTRSSSTCQLCGRKDSSFSLVTQVLHGWCQGVRCRAERVLETENAIPPTCIPGLSARRCRMYSEIPAALAEVRWTTLPPA